MPATAMQKIDGCGLNCGLEVRKTEEITGAFSFPDGLAILPPVCPGSSVDRATAS